MGSPEERITQLGRSRPEWTRTCTKGAYYLAWPYSSVEGDTPLTEEIYKVFCISRRSFLETRKKQSGLTESYISELSLGKPVRQHTSPGNFSGFNAEPHDSFRIHTLTIPFSYGIPTSQS